MRRQCKINLKPVLRSKVSMKVYIHWNFTIPLNLNWKQEMRSLETRNFELFNQMVYVETLEISF